MDTGLLFTSDVSNYGNILCLYIMLEEAATFP